MVAHAAATAAFAKRMADKFEHVRVNVGADDGHGAVSSDQQRARGLASVKVRRSAPLPLSRG